MEQYRPGPRQPRTGQRCNAIDIHEIMKRNIYDQGVNSDPNYRFDNLLPPPGVPPGVPMTSDTIPIVYQNGTYDTHLTFESPYSTGAVDRSAGQLSWDLSALNNNKAITNIVEIKVAPFFFPNFLPVNSTAQPDYFYYRRVWMFIQNFPDDGVGRGANGRRYHYEFAVQNINSTAVELVPMFDTLYLRQPLNTLSVFTVQFSIPANNAAIPIPPDNVQGTAVAGSNPARFTVADSSLFGPVGLLTPAIAVFISGFNSNDPAVNTATNSARGVYVTTVVSPTVIEIAGLNFATVVGAPTATIAIGKNRISMPFRFSSVTSGPTNYILPTHN